MTSRNLFFKLAKEDLKRRVWLAALSVLTFFFAFPVGMALNLGNVEERYEMALRHGEVLVIPKSQAMLEAAGRLVSAQGNGLTVFLMIMAAVVCGASSFSYLHNKRKVDFYHSLPLKRETLFAVSYTMGILIPGIIYGLCLILSLVVAAAYGTSIGGLFKTAASGWLFHMLYFSLVYSTVVLAMIMTGNLVVGILGSSVFFFYFPMLSAMILAYCETWFVTYVDAFRDSFLFRMVKISPIASYIIAFSGADVGAGDAAAFGRLIVESVIALAALILVNILLYKKRPSEAAGKAMAFSASKPVIRIALAMVIGMSGGMFFWLLHSTTGWAVFGTIVGILLCHCIVEIIYHFDFRRLLAHKLQLAGCMIAGLAILFCFKNDWLGYDAYLPEESQVAEAAIDLGNDSWVIYSQVESRGEGVRPKVTTNSSMEYTFNNMKLTDTAPVLEIAKIGVEKALMEKADRESSLEKYDEEGYWTWLHVQYTLKNGRKVQRQYNLPLTLAFDAANTISMDPAYQDIKYPVFQRTAEDTVLVQYRVEGSGNLLESAEFSDQETIEQLLSAYQQDFREMDLYQRQEEDPIGELRFLNAPEVELMEYRKNEYDNSVIQWDGTLNFYPIYPCFDRTLALLEREEINPEKVWDHLDVSSVVAERGMKKGDPGYREREWRSYEVTYTDQEEIQEILNAMALEEYHGMNAYTTTDDITVTVNVGRGNRMKFSVSGYFMEDKAPDMVKEDLDQKLQELTTEFQDKPDETE